MADLGIKTSGGALRKQVAVLANNIPVADTGPLKRYDGYTVMPITVARHRLMLVEMDRDGRPAPTVPFPDLSRPRRSTWWVDRYALPVSYFKRILRDKSLTSRWRAALPTGHGPRFLPVPARSG